MRWRRAGAPGEDRKVWGCGGDAGRRLAARARADLDERVRELMSREAARYGAVLDTVPIVDTARLVSDARALVDEVAAEARR